MVCRLIPCRLGCLTCPMKKLFDLWIFSMSTIGPKLSNGWLFKNYSSTTPLAQLRPSLTTFDNFLPVILLRVCHISPFISACLVWSCYLRWDASALMHPWTSEPLELKAEIVFLSGMTSFAFLLCRFFYIIIMNFDKSPFIRPAWGFMEDL